MTRDQEEFTIAGVADVKTHVTVFLIMSPSHTAQITGRVVHFGVLFLCQSHCLCLPPSFMLQHLNRSIEAG